MGNYLLCCTPARSHMEPMLTIAADLHQRGHRVRLLTGQRFSDVVRATGVEHVALPPACDYDDTDTDAAFPGRVGLSSMARLRYDLDHIFLDAIPHQHKALTQLIDARPAGFDPDRSHLLWGDAADPGSGRAAPADPGRRVPPVGVHQPGHGPLRIGPPAHGWAAGRLRNKMLAAAGHRIFKDNERHGAELLQRECGRAPAIPFLDWFSLADAYLQLSVRELEYPRSDLPANVTFVGPVLPRPSATRSCRRGGRRSPVPTAQSCTSPKAPSTTPTSAGSSGPPCVASPTSMPSSSPPPGAAPLSAIPGEVPANARITDFIPHANLLPHVDVMITNGGFGGVQQAVAHGIPLIVAGDSEDKPEVAARVAWTRIGINLRTATPNPAKIRKAVHRPPHHTHLPTQRPTSGQGHRRDILL